MPSFLRAMRDPMLLCAGAYVHLLQGWQRGGPPCWSLSCRPDRTDPAAAERSRHRSAAAASRSWNAPAPHPCQCVIKGESITLSANFGRVACALVAEDYSGHVERNLFAWVGVDLSDAK